MADSHADSNRIGALETAATIINAVQEQGPAGVSELASELDIPKSTVHAHLKTFEYLGWVLNEGGEYQLGLEFLERGGYVRKQIDLFEVARPIVDELSRETGEVVNLGYEERGKRVLLYTAEPAEGIFDNAPVGQFTHMHWTALGKSLLAQLPDERIHNIADKHGLPRATENTITNRDTLFEEIETVQKRGYSVENEERREGIRAIAVPIGNKDDHLDAGAISISGPRGRIGDDGVKDSLVDALRDAADIIQLKYKHY